jgi:glucose-1-phosphate adenylyltransferase
MKRVTAVILGGGQGARLMPLTRDRAKPAVGFAGKYRIVDIAMSNCINSGLKRIFVLTQFLSASLHRHIMQTYQFDTFTDGFVDILAAEQTLQRKDWFQGTADAVRATLRHITYYASDNILIMAGDHLYRMNFQEVIRHHHQTRADITLCVYPVAREEASRMGLLRVDASGEVKEFIEKPQDPAILSQFAAPASLFRSRGLNVESGRYLASMGTYVFEPRVLLDLLEDTSRTDFGREVIPSALGRYRVVAWPFTDYWKDIGTIPAFFEANIALTSANPSFSLYAPRWPLYTHSRSVPPSRVFHSEIRDSLIVEGSNITSAGISNSIVGTRSVVAKGAHLDHVVMLGADFYEGEHVPGASLSDAKHLPHLGVGANCVIERAILDKNVRIGKGTVIRAKPDAPNTENDLYCVRDGVTIIPKGTVIPPGTEI